MYSRGMTRKKALVTGGTKGIGRAVAARLIASGYDLLLTYAHDQEAAHQVQLELLGKQPDAQVLILQADATDMKSVDTVVSAVRDKDFILDAVVLNAGITDRSSFEDLTQESWERVFAANVHFPTFLIQGLLDSIREGASVVFTGSAMGIHPHSMSLSYGVTKASVHALVKNLVKFLSPRGIRVNAVAPGFVDTEWQKTKPAHIRESINSKIALGRFCDPEELTDAYMLLIENLYLNGEIVTVDGGYSYA